MDLSRNHCCYENATIVSLCIVIDLQVAFNNTKQLRVVMEVPRCTSFAVMSYKIFSTSFKFINIFSSLCKVHDIFV